MNVNIEKITIFPGINKTGQKEPFELLNIHKGEVVAVVGPTGAGKSQLLYDIEKLSQGESNSGRKIYINDGVPNKSWRFDPRLKLIASLAQSMNFLTDMSVNDFLRLHAKARNKSFDLDIIEKVLTEANQITGEPIDSNVNLLNLSGGQTRALMVADMAIISDSPIILIDEIENAGIKKEKAIELLIKKEKIVLLVTHDPVQALKANKRLIVKNGGIVEILVTSKKEKDVACYLNSFENFNLKIREDVREGRRIEDIEYFAKFMIKEEYKK